MSDKRCTPICHKSSSLSGTSGTPPKHKWKLSPEFLLEQLLVEVGLDATAWSNKLLGRLTLAEARPVTTATAPAGGVTPGGDSRHQKYTIWQTPTAMITSTVYGRITAVEWRSGTRVTYRKRKIINRGAQ